MSEHNPAHARQAEAHFNQALRQARRDQFWGWLFGRPSAPLVPFEAVQGELPYATPLVPELAYIPLDRIVGSVGRCDEFTRDFLPLHPGVRERWVRVETRAMERGWPPIHVYEVGGLYFVIDGNHRVAVARRMGYDTIEAYVARVALDGELDPQAPTDQLLMQIGERHFMAQTQLDSHVPDHGLTFTTPGCYQHIFAQVVRLRDMLADLDGAPMTLPEAAVAWYDIVYAPAALLIDLAGLLADYPGRTTGDLFLWLFVNRAALRARYGDFENWDDLLARIHADRDRPQPAH